MDEKFDIQSNNSIPGGAVVNGAQSVEGSQTVKGDLVVTGKIVLGDTDANKWVLQPNRSSRKLGELDIFNESKGLVGGSYGGILLDREGKIHQQSGGGWGDNLASKTSVAAVDSKVDGVKSSLAGDIYNVNTKVDTVKSSVEGQINTVNTKVDRFSNPVNGFNAGSNNITCGTLNANGDLIVTGKILIGTGDSQWTLNAGMKENWLNFYNTKYGPHQNNHGRIIMDGKPAYEPNKNWGGIWQQLNGGELNGRWGSAMATYESVATVTASVATVTASVATVTAKVNSIPNPLNGFNAGINNITCGSLNVTGTATCQTLNISSDRRIKQNIHILTSDTSLELLNKMKPVRYQLKNSTKEVYGFVAQDLQECLPTAVTTQKGVLRNIFQEATCEDSILTFSNFNTSELSFHSETPFPLHIDGVTVQILEILDEKRVLLDKTMDKKTVFVSGQEVDDFLSIDSHQIFTITTSALQALSQKVQRLEEENKALLKRLEEENKYILQRILLLETNQK